MMREIIFRGKRIDNSEWVEGDLLNHDNRVGIHNQLGDGTMNVIDIDPETVGQYTGIKDRSGNKIFEGDIVTFEQYREKKKGKIVFNNKTCALEVWATKIVGAYGEKATNTYLPCHCDYITVVGNIHDNPELLEVQ